MLELLDQWLWMSLRLVSHDLACMALGALSRSSEVFSAVSQTPRFYWSHWFLSSSIHLSFQNHKVNVNLNLSFEIILWKANWPASRFFNMNWMLHTIMSMKVRPMRRVMQKQLRRALYRSIKMCKLTAGLAYKQNNSSVRSRTLHKKFSVMFPLMDYNL